METIYNIIKTIPVNSNIFMFSATMPGDVINLTEKILNNPENILVDNMNLTLDGIKQYYVNVKISDWKIDVIKDLYDTINISSLLIL